ncbi:PDDEXK nuclease domain-containing protein [Xenorhabdus bovienii]|uniref:PDDEXK nuclease domain-containing protein n=1 Tax=Xenorhabdus bovienii TaxID=40576 RepID=A0AAJ1JB50_XENBV|nr:PDDEXK nuclease domain-containing protein [Xenorhabdus bovienii]MDE1480515.1 PDDEXK nuclease domain-containing protein [Xenorhabdus bovienii]MDE1492932.1 PDDEXK nuclease domain-containing protein [Xenorhabdus bovienii]MDE9512198.1 PDDEXK nuclease domain-containing protein [Xenorhabdus bovienii]MDE9523859.1 PDDEXK nuclease domain-containing protein [Xenorhabdus bovienii]
MTSELQIYTSLLTDVKKRIRGGQLRAAQSINTELIQMYWDIGRMLHKRQKQQGWGAGIIPKLARDIANELPEVKGFSERNLKRMLRFYREYAFPSGMEQQSNIHSSEEIVSAIVPQPVAQLPWGHNILLIERIKDQTERFWYAEQVQIQGWSRDSLIQMIKSNVYARQGSAISNFQNRLSISQSELVQQTLKDPYIFDFLTLSEPFKERELEMELLKHLEKFLLELGEGFAFVGRQYPITVSDQDYYIDLLFYHLTLRAFVVIELKRGEFKPEYAGKMNFYCSVVDEKLRHATDQPTIGLILCQTKDRILAEYALRGIQKPIGVSDYELTRALPEDLKSSLPSIEELEAELSHGSENT